ncbi:MAG: 30S ribosomal protein THX [Candidatus Omnitrophica bacterium]|nr:30S ribosomal protein THX [Candidatus Omnitrophota bacterium]
MGKGDRRTKRGKICNGSHGKTRPWKKEKARSKR